MLIKERDYQGHEQSKKKINGEKLSVKSFLREP
jgi:hypothetical protein